MVKLDVVKSANQSLAHSQPLVAVFVGATQGIGDYTLRALARNHGSSGKGLRVYLLGRREDRANAIFEDCRKLCPSGEFIFVSAPDLTLLSDVDSGTKKLSAMEERAPFKGGPPKIDMLFMTQGFVRFGDPECKSRSVYEV